ncbi:D-allose ABC transporter permease [Peptoniphilaceae bacterium SGI.131]
MENKGKKLSFSQMWQRFGTLGIFLILMIILGALKPSAIFSIGGLGQILTQSSVNILLALGEFFAILIAGIELSVGSVAALTGLLVAKMMVAGMSVPLAIVLGILFALVLGFINGFLVVKTKLHPFIITLGTQSIFRGIILVASGSRSTFGFPDDFIKFMSLRILGMPITFIIALFVALVLWFFSMKTKAGRNIYAIGGNPESAWYSGIDVNKHTVLVFMIAGICAGIAGVVLLGRVGAAEPGAATGFETYAIAATIIGGTSFSGGKGHIFGVVIGGLIIGIINFGMTVLTIPSTYQQIVMGALIIISVTMDRIVAQKK